MTSLFFSLFNCFKSSAEKRPTTVSGIPDDPVEIVITTEPRKDEGGSLTTDESYLPNYNNIGFESEDEEEEETDSETEEQDYRQFSSTINVRENDLDTVEEIIPPSTSDSINFKSDYDKLFYSNATAQILMDLESKEQLTVSFLQQKHLKFLEKVSANTVEKLLVHASLIEIIDEVCFLMNT